MIDIPSTPELDKNGGCRQHVRSEYVAELFDCLIHLMKKLDQTLAAALYSKPRVVYAHQALILAGRDRNVHIHVLKHIAQQTFSCGAKESYATWTDWHVQFRLSLR